MGIADSGEGVTHVILPPNAFSTGMIANGNYEAYFSGLTLRVRNWHTGQHWSGKLPGLTALKSAAMPLLVERWGTGTRVLVQYYHPKATGSNEMVGALAWADLDQHGLHLRSLVKPADFVGSLQWPGAVRVSDGVLVAGVGTLGWLPAGQTLLRVLYQGADLRRLGQPVDFDLSLDADSGPWLGSWRGMGLVELANGANGRSLILAERMGKVIGSLEWDTGTGKLLAVSGAKRQTVDFQGLTMALILPKAG